MRFIFALLVAATLHAQPALQGLGASTYTCLDKDGDTYGVGPGCAGVDSDDKDSTIHTGAEIVSKYGTLAAALSHLGYTPLRQWFIATTGNNGTCSSGGAPVGIGSPCADFAGVTLAAGDAVIYRAGTYTTSASRFAPATNGTSSNPIIVMAYPGEAVVFDTQSIGGSAAIDLIDRVWITADGFTITGGLSSGGIALGCSAYTGGSNVSHDITVRNMRLYHNKWGIIGGGFDNLLIEDIVAYDHAADGGEHGIYLGAKGNRLSSNITVRRTITYGNDRAGIQMNGNISNLAMDQNIAYGNEITGFSWENGIHDSFARSNLAFNNGASSGFAITNYDGKEGTNECPSEGGANICVCTPTPSVEGSCAHNQTGNLIENFTSVQMADHLTPNTGQTTAQHALLVGKQHTACSTATCLGTSLGGNTFRNILLVAYTTDANHSPIVFQDDDNSLMADLATTTISNYLAYDAGASHRSNILTHLYYGVSWTNWTCANAGNSLGSGGAGITLSSCNVADPQFIAYNPAGYATPASFDFRLGSASPALRAGTATGVPDYDLKGRSFVASPGPSIGAIERQLYSNGWTDLGSSSGLRTAICPADGASSSVCGSGGASCGGSGTPYPYQATCGSTIQSWSSAVARTKPGSEGLFLWGGGHTDGGSNAVFKLTVNTTSPAMTRVIDASQITAADFTNCPSVLGDGRPNTRHTYGQLAYLPTQDSMFAFAGSLYCGNGSHDSKTWWLDFPGLSWSAKDPVNAAGYDPAANNGGFVSAGACAYDPNSDGVYCNNYGSILAYNPASNRYYQAYTGYYDGVSPSAVVDSHRRQWLQISNGHAYKVDIANGFSSALTITDITANIDASCSTLMAAAGPGLVYNPVLDRIVGYPPNGGNTVYLMNPGDYTCTTQTFSGGPANNSFGSPQPGTYGRFNYFPSLDVYAVVNGYNQNALVLNLNASDPGSGGTGGSSRGGTLTIGGSASGR